MISIKLTDGQTFSGHTTENIVLRQITTTNDASDTPTSDTPTAPTDVGGGGIVTGGDQSPTSESTTTETPTSKTFDSETLDSPLKQCGLFNDEDEKSIDKTNTLKGEPKSKNDEDTTNDTSDSDDDLDVPRSKNIDAGDWTHYFNGSDDEKTEDATKNPNDTTMEQQDAPKENPSGSDNKEEAEDAATKNPTDSTMEEQDTPTENPSGSDNDGAKDATTKNPTNAKQQDAPTEDATTENPTDDNQQDAPTEDATTTENPTNAKQQDAPTEDATIENPTNAKQQDAPTEDATTKNPTNTKQQDAPMENPTKANNKRSIVSSDSEMTISDKEEDEDDFGDDDSYVDDSSDDEGFVSPTVPPTKRLKQYHVNPAAPYFPKKDEVPDAPTMVLAETWHNDKKNFGIIDKVNKANAQPDSHFTIEEQAKNLYPYVDSTLTYLDRGTTLRSRQIKVVVNISKYHLFGELLEIPETLLDEDESDMVIKLLGVLTTKLRNRKSPWDALAYIISTYNLRADTYYLESWYPGPGRRGEPTFASLYGAGWNTTA
jgi:hypothetical protein